MQQHKNFTAYANPLPSLPHATLPHILGNCHTIENAELQPTFAADTGSCQVALSGSEPLGIIMCLLQALVDKTRF
jgi:hypothetical protein